ncbi:hypothetical protein Droror1_Dr00022322 [Drosera rotundifolia]
MAKQAVEKIKEQRERYVRAQNSLLFKHFEVYPHAIRRGTSLLSLSSISLSSSLDSSLTDSSSSALDTRILLSLETIRKIRALIPEVGGVSKVGIEKGSISPRVVDKNDGELGRCNWITKNSDKLYVSFHDEQWGVPVYEDNQLFELLTMSGMLIDYNWTEILKRKELLREVFGGFEPNFAANMGEKEISDIASNKELGLAECRARCIIDNARGIVKVVKEYGSFSSFLWGYFDYKPIINKYRYPKNVPLRSPKAEIISKELIRHGFRLVGPVITQSFIQAAGMTIDHLVDCFRYSESVRLAECPWKHA